MIRANSHFEKLKSSYLFRKIADRVKAFQEQHPEVRLIRLGIGDVTQPLPEACLDAFHKAVEEMGHVSTFRGYGPAEGYEFLRQAIAENDYRAYGADIGPDEIFVSDGSKGDCGNFQELFARDIVVGIPDPVYPVYLDSNVMAGRTGSFVDSAYQGVVYLPCSPETGFVPRPPELPVDLVYLCSPNNPTGTILGRDDLTDWVDWAKENKALILFDAAYAAFVRKKGLPRSIFEIDGAREVAVEFRSFSKTAGFTGTRCAFTVVPKDCRVFDDAGNLQPLYPLWYRRQTTKFNGVSYPVQRAAEATYSPEGQRQIDTIIEGYLKNADEICKTMKALGYEVAGGKHSPYVWVDAGMDDWAFFDLLLEKAGVVSTPGSGFGAKGAGYVRISAFGSSNGVVEAMTRIQQHILLSKSILPGEQPQ